VLGCHAQLKDSQPRFLGLASGPFSPVKGIGAVAVKMCEKSARL
jgi:hypothetical protein